MSSSAATVLPETPPAQTEPTPHLARDDASGVAAPPLFSPDRGDAQAVERPDAAELLAELLCHRDAGTPLMVGLYGGAGSGKSSLLAAILERIETLSGSARPGGVFLPGIVAVKVDASSGGDPAATLLQHLHAGLADSHPTLAEEAQHAGSDPHEVARVAGEKVNDLRRQLDAERQTLDDLNGRRAKLTETVLFNAAGSRVDAYARANRARIEGRLRAFGLPTADSLLTYKDLVRDAAENRGGPSRLGLAWRALSGFKGQGTLLTLTVVLLIVGIGLGVLDARQPAWTAWLDGFGDRTAALKAWAVDHAGWLSPLSHLAYALAVLALLIALVRAIRFLQPVLRGAALLDSDIEGRRHDLDGLLAHQTRRVDGLGAEVEAAVRQAEAHDRRAQANHRPGGSLPPLAAMPGTAAMSSPTGRAAAFVSGLSAALSAGNGKSETPDRVVVAIDELDRLAPQDASAWLDTAQRLLSRPGFATIAAFDRAQVLHGFAEADPALAAARLRRCVQLSYDLDAGDDGLGPSADQVRAKDGGSLLDLAWRPYEGELLSALGRFAPSHRGRKTLANRYRLARADARLRPEHASELAGLAVALALDGTPGGTELSTLAQSSGVELPHDGDVGAALRAAEASVGTPLDAAQVRHGMRVARSYAQG